MFDRSWSEYCRQLFKRASTITGFEEDPDFSREFHAIVYAHKATNNLSVIHLKKTLGNFEELRKKAKVFLETL